MLLGKRPRAPMRRTTSLTEISFDLGAVEEGAAAPPPLAGNPRPPRHQRQQQNPQHAHHMQSQQQHMQYQHQGPSTEGLDTRYLSSIVSPRNPRRNFGDFAVEPAHFLRACGLCKRRLGPGKDTFMYRGEVAFCSLECRQQQMNQDERKEKCTLTSMKTEPPAAVAASTSDASVDGETVAAA